MSSIDAGYEFISNYSDKEVKDLYIDRITYAKKYLKESKLEAALGMVEDAAYYSDELSKRKIIHKSINYEHITKDLCDIVYKKL